MSRDRNDPERPEDAESTMTQLPWELEGDNEWLHYWRAAEPHRQILTDLILDVAKPGASVCIWGAGSCHDLDLKRIMEAGVWLTLVDINEQNVRWGTTFQLGSAAETVRVAAPIDLLGAPRDDRPPLSSLPGVLARHRVQGLGEYDMVVSAGMLSQIVLHIVEWGGGAVDPPTLEHDQQTPANDRSATDPALVTALVATRRQHARLMLDHLVVGGTALLVVDWINSSDVPEIATADDLEAVVEAAATATDHTHVLSPMHLNRDLMLHPPLARRIAGVNVSNHWRWQMTERTYACFALRFQKKR